MAGASPAGLAPATLADLDVVVLAGGLGTRLRPAVADRPKALAQVGGRPFLDLLLAWLHGQGARRVVLALGHMADQVEARLGDLCSRFPGLELRASVEPGPLGTGGALRHCLPLLRSDPVLVANGDSLAEADLAGFLAAFLAAADAPAAGLVAVGVPDASRYGRLELSPEGRVLRFAEKDPAFAGPAPINGGVYLFRHDLLLERLPPAGTAGSLERDLLGRLPPGSALAFPGSGRFVDIGTPESLAAAAEILSPYL